MIFNSSLFDATAPCLDIDPASQTEAWQHSQRFATPASQWNAYLNQLCLQVVLPWLQDDDPQARPLFRPISLDSIWELVNGIPMQLGDRTTSHNRIVLVPSETIDSDEWRIPREWVDIPDWVADYYILVQVNVDDSWMRLTGFITHHQLKQKAQLDQGDRTYTLNDSDWNPDLNALWVSRRLAPEEMTQAAIAPLPALALAQAESLLQRLGQAERGNPRLDVPFELWGALIQHGGWRQQLMARRRGEPPTPSVAQWLQSGITTLLAHLGWERLELQAAASARGDEDVTQPTTGLSRVLAIAGQSYELRILPINTPAGAAWRFELRNLTPGGRIPGGVVLRLLTEDLQAFDQNEDRAIAATDALFVDVMVSPGEGIVWEIEPTPDDYDREIIRF